MGCNTFVRVNEGRKSKNQAVGVNVAGGGRAKKEDG